MSRYDTLHYRSGEKSCVDVATIPGFMTPEQCDDLIVKATMGGFSDAATVPQAEGKAHEKNYRITKEFYLDDQNFPDIWNGLAQTLVNVNNSHFQYDITSLEPPVVLRYSPGGEYKWHRDMGADYTAYRKLSMVVQLSPVDDYEGGQLEYFSEGIKNPPDNQQGTLYIFPSWLNHCVTPVTKGLRYSLVCWSTGLKLR